MQNNNNGKRILCTCGVRFTPWQRALHERSIWHLNWDLIKRCLEAKMTNAEIATQLGVSPAYVSVRVKRQG